MVLKSKQTSAAALGFASCCQWFRGSGIRLPSIYSDHWATCWSIVLKWSSSPSSHLSNIEMCNTQMNSTEGSHVDTKCFRGKGTKLNSRPFTYLRLKQRFPLRFTGVNAVVVVMRKVGSFVNVHLRGGIINNTYTTMQPSPPLLLWRSHFHLGCCQDIIGFPRQRAPIV